MTFQEYLDALAGQTPVDLSTITDRGVLASLAEEARVEFTNGWDREAGKAREGADQARMKIAGTLFRDSQAALAALPPVEVPVVVEDGLGDLAALIPTEIPAPVAPVAPVVVPEAKAAAIPEAPLGDINPAGKQAAEDALRHAKPRPLGLVAASTSDGFYSGQESELSLERLQEQILRRGEGLLAGQGSHAGVIARLASTSLPYNSPYRLSPRNTAQQNSRIMAEMDAMPQAMTAAGGYCGPIDFVRDIPFFAVLGRPVYDSLRKRPAQRGRFKINAELPLYDSAPSTPAAATYPGIEKWTVTEDDAADFSDPDTWKTVDEMDCDQHPAEITVTTHALTRNFVYSHMQQMSSPELLEALLRRQKVRWDRYADSLILDDWHDQAVSDGTAYTFTPPYGQVTDTFFALAEALRGEGWLGRYDWDGATLYVPKGFLDYFVVAEMNAGFGNRPFSRAEVLNIIKSFGFDAVIEVLDDRASAGAWTYAMPSSNAALDEQKTTAFPLYIVYRDDYFVADSGVIDFGVDRDTMARVNKLKIQWESFEGLGAGGHRPVCFVTVTLKATGARAGLVTPWS